MATVIYYIRTSKNTNPNKKISVRIRFRHGREINLYAKSGLKILPYHFSNETHTVNKQTRYEDKYKDKQYLDKLESVILAEFKTLQVPPSSEWLNTVIDKFLFPDKYQEKPKTLFSFIQDFIQHSPRRINQRTNKPVSYKMIREYHSTFGYLQKYAKELDFNDIDLDFYGNFKHFLEKQGLALNTIGKKITVLKIFLNEATARGLNTNFKYQSSRFRAITENSESIYLDIEELDKISNLDLSNKHKIDRVRDLFLVGCWTGLRFSDWSKVSHENIKNGLITLIQGKTGQPVVIPIHPTVKAVFDKYNGKLPTPISNQRFNEYLKEVAKLAGIKGEITKHITRGGKRETISKHKWEVVTTHTARRSFATNAYKMGMQSITIMAITGHRTETAFLKYIKVTPEQHARKMQEIWLKVSN